MRVKIAFADFLAHLHVARSGVAAVLIAVFFLTSSFTEHTNREGRAKQVNLMIRQAGHRLLLLAGDSTSRILPVTEMKEGTFLLRFENEFVFNHDSLMALSARLLPKKQFPAGYTVTVHDCKKGNIVYGFQVNNTSPDILACMGRSQSAGCYTIEFAFPDLYENVKQQNAEINQPTESVRANTQDVNQKLAESKSPATGGKIRQQTAELKSFNADSQRVNASLEASKTTTFDNSLRNVAYVGILALLGIAFYVRRSGKFLEQLPGDIQNRAIINEPGHELPALGKFLFNVKGQRLLLDSEVVSLTDKECKVLDLLYKNFGELIPRETLMQEVWINEGVFTGRSLDMFVSKLRKKLSHDPDLKITNVHGKGYKLGYNHVQATYTDQGN